MRISYVGNRKSKASDGKSFNTEHHVALTLEKVGHEVNFIQEDEIEVGWLPDQVTHSDLFLWTRTWDDKVTEADLNAIKKLGITTASIHLDKYSDIKRDGGLGQDLFWKTDHIFSPEGSVQSRRIFKSHNMNQHYLPAAVFEDECYIAEPVDEFKHDVVFVGGGADYSHPEWPYRAKLVKWLQDTYGDRFGKYGHPERTVRGEELNQVYSSSKIAIGDSLCKDFIDSYYYSDRQFEATGRGAFLITPYIAGVADHFTDRKEAVFYAFDNFTQLKNLIDYYLEHDDEREAIRLAGHERTKRENTYTNRMKQMLDIIEGSRASNAANDARPHSGIKINLGAGSEPDKSEGWVNVDLLDLPGIEVVHNLLHFPYPFEDESAELIKAIDLLEHLPNYTPEFKPAYVQFIEECWRILKTGGELVIQVPHWNSPNMWIDPTHVRGFDPHSFDYFDPETDLGKAYGYYSDKKFKVETTEANGNITFKLVKL